MSATSDYRNTIFAFDIGTNSLGWCVLSGARDADNHIIPNRILDIGARIFSDGRDPQSGASLAVARREARGQRRMRDRYVRRRQKLLDHLTEYGLMPAETAARAALLRETADRSAKQQSEADKTDPYNLRARALEEKLPLHHFGRALFHLNQRRGFKSNRKTDRKDNDKGKIAMGVEELQAQMRLSRAPTLGAYLAGRYNAGKVVRIRQDSEAFLGEKQENYLFYPERSMLEQEFAKIWEAQAEFYPDILTDTRRDRLFNDIFYQRPLKEPKPGKCSFNPDEERLPKAHPLFQEFRLYKEVNDLTLETAGSTGGQKLDKEQRDTLIKLLRPKKKMAFSAIRKELKLHGTFKKEKNAREGLAGNEIYAEMTDKTRFGNQWAELSLEKQGEIITKLRDEQNDERLDNWLAEQFPNLSAKQRDEIADAPLPEGYGRLGKTALTQMLEKMQAAVIAESEAARLCGYDHALLNSDREGLPKLPPYQEVLSRQIPPGTGDPADDYDTRMGRITNPTVHIALNQLRRVVNALLHKYGKPQEMAVELARELQLSDKEKLKVNKAIAENTKAAILRSNKLEETGILDNGYNRQLLKLWEELSENPENRLCPYSGEPISITRLFSADVEIEHILPYSRTLDDSNANKTVSLKKWNAQKGNLSPVEAAARLDGWDYESMLARAQNLPKGKRWRFAKDAMERFENDDNWLARQLTDTQYLSRLAREYLSSLYPGKEESFDTKTGELSGKMRVRYRVRTIPGKMTELFRRNWGLNDILHDRTADNDTAKPKNRQDHRHHAIDAAVIGITTRSQLQRISAASRQMEGQELENFVKQAVSKTLPWENFRQDLQAAVDGIIVSHKPDHGTLPGAKAKKQGKGKTAAKLMKETAYGLPTDAEGSRLKDEKGNLLVVWRVPLRALKAKDLDNIRDPYLSTALKEYIYSETGGLQDGKDFEQALLSFRSRSIPYKGIRHVRLIGARNTIPIYDGQGKAYKGYWNDGNYRYDVWQTLDGKWKHDVISMFDAHQPHYQSPFHRKNPTAKKVLSLQQNDMVAYNNPETGKRIIARVVKFGVNGQIVFAEHNEANVDKRDKDKNDPFKYFIKMAGALKEWKLRQIRVDEIGQVFDPQQQENTQ